MSRRVLGVVPARLASTRLSRKPLHDLAGLPLIEWVWRRVVETGLFSEVVIATDAEEVAEIARGFGARVELTSPDHPSGTDRIAEVAARAEYRDFTTVVNVQGDEPFLTAEHLEPGIDLVESGTWRVGTVATPITALDELNDRACVKVVRDDSGGALYFSRASIPFMRDREPASDDFATGAYLRHIGIYVYEPDALIQWVRLPRNGIEQIEQLEQLRPLSAGIRIGVAVVGPLERGVDTPADAARAETRLREEPLRRHR